MTTAGKDNLTRDEAQARAAVVSDPVYRIVLDLSGDGDTFTSETTVGFAATGDETFIDLDAARVHTIELNGAKVPVEAASEGRIALAGLKDTNELVVRADCSYSRTGTGLHRFTDPVDGLVYCYTQFEPFDAHRVFACFDQPDIKGTFAFDVAVPEDWVVVSNTKRTGDENGRWTFETTPRMSTYIAAVCAGPFHSVHDKHGDIALAWHCRRSLAQHLDPDELFEITKQGFDFFTRIFDYPYMLDTYDQVFCPEYKFGAMENLGCVTYSERMIYRSKVTEADRERRAEVILHEMSHMWFGDLVTMRWWNDLWLNESFATYMAYLAKERATRFTQSWVSFLSDEKAWAYRQDQLPTTHPIVADIPDVEATHLNFDGITYAKGASVLRQLVAWVGEEAFFTGLRRYFRRHEYGNTELGDFLGPLAEESGRDLQEWSKLWLETAGVNTVEVSYAEQDGKVAGFDILQRAAEAYPTLRPHRMGVGLFSPGERSIELTRSVELDVVGERTAVADVEGEDVPDIVVPNLGDLAYTKIRFGPSLPSVLDKLRGIRDPLTRSLMWGGLWDMVRDAELPAREWVRVVLENVPIEADPGVLRDLLNRAQSAVTIYGHPDNRDQTGAIFAGSTYGEMLAAKPGSDAQLTWAHAFIRAARDDDHVRYTKGFLDGTTRLDGLAVDTDLRWHIASSLAAAGEIDDDVIAAELDRDPTDQGERHAAGARAARPTGAAKQQAWEQLVGDPDLTLAMSRALSVGLRPREAVGVGGFQQADQEEVLEPYVERYFAELVPQWKKRELDLGLSFAGGMYPRLYTQAVVDRTEELLADDQLPKPLRRILLEHADDAKRVIRARERDVL